MRINYTLRYDFHQPDCGEDDADAFISGNATQTLQNPLKIAFLNRVTLHVSKMLKTHQRVIQTGYSAFG